MASVSRSITLPAIPLAVYRYELDHCSCLVTCPSPPILGCAALMVGTMRIFSQTLRKVDWLLETPGITVCCPGHGYCVSAESMREKLRLMEDEARNLTDVQLMNAERIGALKSYVDELLEETAALFTILSGRLYTVSYYLSLLEEDSCGKSGSCDAGYRPNRPHPLRVSPICGSVQRQRSTRTRPWC